MNRLLFLCFACFFLVFQPALARVDILPHLLVLEGRDRSTEVIILNLEEGKNEFKVGLLNYKQDEEGLYETLETPLSDLFDPADIVRISPTNFTLDQLGRQKVRIALRKPADLPEAEYRFHLLATGYEVKDPSTKAKEDTAVSVDINVGVAIPVIVRHGDNFSATGKLKDFKLIDPSETRSKKPELAFTATREGNASTLGRVSVSWAPAGSDVYEEIGFITNFNLFTEINQRSGSIALDKVPSGKGILRVLYTDTHTEAVYDEVLINQ